MTKLSIKTWDTALSVVDAIKQHPFNQELANGTLALDKFAYYIEQDSFYLIDFARCHALIAARAPTDNIRCFLRFAEETFIAEQEMVHQFFRQEFNFSKTGLMTPAALSYTSYLLKTCALQPVEVAIAAVLPCFWVYREVGQSIVQHAGKENPYSRWIATYSGKEFAESVEQAIGIFDAVAATASADTCDKMINAFYTSTLLEWHFWNDAYHKRVFDDISQNAVPSTSQPPPTHHSPLVTT